MVGLGLLGAAIGMWLAYFVASISPYPAHAEGSRRGILMDVNRTGYHMLVVIGERVSMLNDVTAEECANAATILKQHATDAWVCCYHTPDQAAACK